MVNQLVTRKGECNGAEVWGGRKGGVGRRRWRVPGINWQKKRKYHIEKGHENKRYEITYTCTVCGRGGEGGWGDGEGYMGNIWEGMELIKADETGGEGKS